MGNNSTVISGEPLDPNLLQGGFPVNKTFIYDVTSHHTTQKAYSSLRILKFTQVDRRSEAQLKLNGKPRLQFCLERHFQLTDLLTNASLPSKCRHPYILRVHRTISDPIHNCLFLLTEPCLPLDFLISSCTETDLLLGARSILSGLNFIHTNLSVSHNNIHSSSIFVGSDSKWKLGGFEFALPFTQMDNDVIELLERLFGDSTEPNPAAIAFHSSYPSCYDIYSFSRLLSNLVSQHFQDSKLFDDFLQVLHKSCRHLQPKARLTSAQLLAHPIFRHPLIHAINFFENYVTYTDSEKMEFFQSFEDKVVKHLPMELICLQLIPLCLNNTVFLDPPSQALIHQILRPYNDSFVSNSVCPAAERHSWLSSSAFKKYVSPLILGKFRIRERQTRITLLERFTGYVHLFEISELTDTILPEVCMSLFDQYEALSQLSLEALGSLSRLVGSTHTLNALRQTELRLTRQGVFGSRSTTKQINNPAWPRAHLFAEAAPKISRQQREIPLSERRQEKLSLAQLATLSANYEPNSNPLLWQSSSDSPSSPEPQRLVGNAIRMSKPQPAFENRATMLNGSGSNSVSSDVIHEDTCQRDKPTTLGADPSSPSRVSSSTAREVNGQTSDNKPDGSVKISNSLAPQSLEIRPTVLPSLSMLPTTEDSVVNETTWNDWDNDWDFDP